MLLLDVTPASAAAGQWQPFLILCFGVCSADLALKGVQPNGKQSAKHRTLVHGDFKSENVLFNADATQCAAYDFQYCGEGFGVKDVAYMFCSSLDEDVLMQHEDDLLRHYHLQLLAKLGADSSKGGQHEYTFETMMGHYQLCLIDYCRFMAGWGWWGNVDWATRRCQDIVKMLPSLLATT